MPCGTCRAYVTVDASTGECRQVPPLPEGDYRHDLSEFPLVKSTDVCGYFVLGAYPANNCSACSFFQAGLGDGIGGADSTVAYDGVCIALPPVQTGEYRGRLSEWPKQLDTGRACIACYTP